MTISSAEKSPAIAGEHPTIAKDKIGVLLINLGTPNEPTPGAVRRYLREFLSDRRIVDLPRAIWLPVLYGIILNTRPAKTAKAYQKIWRDNPSESPLRFFSREQATSLGSRFDQGDVLVDWAMRYGTPSIKDRLELLKKSGCDRIFVLPLYPQYSATTTGSVHDAVFDAVKELVWQPAIRTAPAFHDEPAYIEALATITRRQLAGLAWDPERFILSFHGIPQRYFAAGDPYHCHCAKTARLLREEMGWQEDVAPLAFQSKFGPEKWLEPSTTDTISKLSAEGIKRIAVITPGFVSDCIETLEEIAIVAHDQFKEEGGEKFTAFTCLNAETEMIDLLQKITERELSGWRN